MIRKTMKRSYASNYGVEAFTWSLPRIRKSPSNIGHSVWRCAKSKLGRDQVVGLIWKYNLELMKDLTDVQTIGQKLSLLWSFTTWSLVMIDHNRYLWLRWINLRSITWSISVHQLHRSLITFEQLFRIIYVICNKAFNVFVSFFWAIVSNFDTMKKKKRDVRLCSAGRSRLCHDSDAK